MPILKAIRGIGFSLKTLQCRRYAAPLGRKSKIRVRKMGVGMVVVT